MDFFNSLVTRFERFKSIGYTLDDIMEPKTVKDNLELIILSKLSSPKCGIDLINEMSDELGVVISPGTLYPCLHSMNKRRLISIKRPILENKTIYTRTKNGRKQQTKLIKDHKKLLTYLGKK